jgi:single stranded DNA-binding protein
LVWEQPPSLLGAQATGQKEEKTTMNLNQLTIIGFIGRDAETKYLPNGAPVVKFTVATKKSWKDETDGWKERTQWHSVIAFGEGFAKTAGRLVKGAHVFVQGELATPRIRPHYHHPEGQRNHRACHPTTRRGTAG